ncbi:MAG: ubiquinone biosynthesis protein UbiA, partial [Acidobacteria bacterium]|nr:ubiquinone biosynthesis protein UbiA [Acidobacteriota bacterium]MDW7985422.1 ubiquinone biosynthesis protein UbiA [Acidobacteriota bacterium]
MRLRAIGESLRTSFLHLRLHFSVVLLPLFLWGFRLTETRPSGAFWLGLLVVHVFLYGGANAFNSYFDRDEGPIGGLYRPPPVSTGTLVVAWVFKALGLLLSLRL